MQLPTHATIDEACEWLNSQTNQKWTLPRLLEDGHLRPYIWIDYVEGHPQIFGGRREGYLTEMVFHGDVVRLATDRDEAVFTWLTSHDGNPIQTSPWRVELKHIRFKRHQLERVAEIVNASTQPQAAPEPAPVVETPAIEPSQWKMKIQIEAAAHMKRLRAAGASPTVHSILDWMEKWCRENEVMTDGGIFPSANYLRTHVLGGKHWMLPR